MRDPWMLLVAADSPLAGREGPVPLHEVARLPLIGARLRRCRMEVDAHFRARGLEPRYVFRSDENGTVRGLVAAGVGIGIVPRLAVDPQDERVLALELGPTVAPRVIALAWHSDRYRQAAAEAFVQLASELCAELQGGPRRGFGRGLAPAPTRALHGGSGALRSAQIRSIWNPRRYRARMRAPTAAALEVAARSEDVRSRT
jgi:LysR substrate binding domain